MGNVNMPQRESSMFLMGLMSGERARILEAATGETAAIQPPNNDSSVMPLRVADQPAPPSITIVENKKYVIYPARWLVLAVCCLLALSNSMQWISYTTLTEETRRFYCGEGAEDCRAAFLTNQIFQFVAVITGIGGMYITDSYGIRLSILSGVSLNLVGSILRLSSSHPYVDSPVTRQALLHTGSVIVACAQAFFLVLPSKIAECWFPEHQRAISNVLTFIANPAGVALGTLAPQFIFDASRSKSFPSDSWELFNFNVVMASLTSLTFFLSLFIRTSLPPSPPSPSNEHHADTAPPFLPSIIICLRNGQFLIQLFTFALGFAQLWGVMVIIPDILAANGYSLAGYPTAVCALVGVGASLVAGALADRTKKFKEIIQFCSIGFFLSALFMRIYLMRAHSGVTDDICILLASALLGAFSIPQFPIGVEMGVETTFPVYEATSSGLLVLKGQLWMFILYAVFEAAKGLDLFYSYPNKDATVGNWKLVLDIWCILSLITATIAVLFLRPVYKRVAYEAVARHQRESEESIQKMVQPSVQA